MVVCLSAWFFCYWYCCFYDVWYTTLVLAHCVCSLYCCLEWRVWPLTTRVVLSSCGAPWVLRQPGLMVVFSQYIENIKFFWWILSLVNVKNDWRWSQMTRNHQCLSWFALCLGIRVSGFIFNPIEPDVYPISKNKIEPVSSFLLQTNLLLGFSSNYVELSFLVY